VFVSFNAALAQRIVTGSAPINSASFNAAEKGKAAVPFITLLIWFGFTPIFSAKFARPKVFLASSITKLIEFIFGFLNVTFVNHRRNK